MVHAPIASPHLPTFVHALAWPLHWPVPHARRATPPVYCKKQRAGVKNFMVIAIDDDVSRKGGAAWAPRADGRVAWHSRMFGCTCAATMGAGVPMGTAMDAEQLCAYARARARTHTHTHTHTACMTACAYTRACPVEWPCRPQVSSMAGCMPLLMVTGCHTVYGPRMHVHVATARLLPTWCRMHNMAEV